MLHLKHGSDYASELFQSKEKLSYADTDLSVYQMVVDNNKEHLDDVALMFLGKRVTYRALIGQADFVADLLASSGLKRGGYDSFLHQRYAAVCFSSAGLQQDGGLCFDAHTKDY